MHQLLKGEIFKDNRGEVRFNNKFNMSEIVRVYEIAPSDVSSVRGWLAHKNETKWLFCSKGKMEVRLVEIDDFQKPSTNAKIRLVQLSENEFDVLKVCGGTGIAFKAREIGSRITVFSDFTLEQSKADDFRFPLETWQIN